MDDLFLKRVLFEWLRDRLLIFQRLIPVLSLRTLATSSRGLKKDYPWSDYLEKLPEGSINCNQSGDDPKIINISLLLKTIRVPEQ
jgi:hypothetical protein